MLRPRCSPSLPPNDANQPALRKQPSRCVGGKPKEEYLPACHECAKQLKPGEERSDCVFEDFRLLQNHKVTGELYEVTAESTATAVADDVPPMHRYTAEYLISHAAQALITVLDRELTFRKTLATPRVEPPASWRVYANVVRSRPAALRQAVQLLKHTRWI